MAVAADDAVDLIRRHTCLVHRLLAGQDGVGTQRLVHRDAIPATVHRRMSDTGHGDLAAMLPYAEPVVVSPPLIPVRRGHGSTFPVTVRAAYFSKRLVASRSRSYRRVSGNGGNQD